MAQPGVFRWKMSASLQGQEGLLKRLLDTASPEARTELLDKAADLVVREAKRLVPRETGELEGEIEKREESTSGDKSNVYVGVPAHSPAIHKARATEKGAWNYGVGEPTNPKTEWPAKSKPTAAMPWLQTALLVAKPRILRAIRRGLVTGRRSRIE